MYLVCAYERRKRRAALVATPRLDVVSLHFEEQAAHARERGRPVTIDGLRKPGGPAEQEKVAEVGVVIRVLVRDEESPQCGKRQPGAHILARRAIAAVHKI